MKSMVKLYIYCRKINTVFSNIRQYTVFHEGKLHNYFQITNMKKIPMFPVAMLGHMT